MHTLSRFRLHPSTLFLVLFFFLVSACSNEQPGPGISVKRVTLEQGDTLAESLRDNGFVPAAGNEIIKSLGGVFNPRSCRPGDYYEVKIDSSGQWLDFHYCPPGLNFYAVEHSTDGRVVSTRKKRPTHKTVMTASGRIKTSLWEAMASQGVEPALINDFADIFAWQIDFLTEPRVGDTYKVIWERFSSDDGLLINGKILAAQYIASGQANNAVLFTNAKGDENYYAPDGKSLRRAFLKAPLQYRRISSFFSRKRFHPVLKRFRPHLGIDYAAPRGTPVSSVGEGTVLFAGRKGGFGKYIQVRHPNGYVSSYGHLHGYARGIRSGVHVRQGQVIGYVGSTGLSTGPHLDFRITRNGSFINFLSLKFPPAQQLTGNDKDRFHLLTKSMMSHLASIRLQ